MSSPHDDIRGCFGCTGSSHVIIQAKYYSKEMIQTVDEWGGYSCVGASTSRSCCSASSSSIFEKYYTEPVNELLPFTFTAYDLTIQIIGHNDAPLENADIIANSPDAFYARCKTDQNGKCAIKNIPENARYNVKASSNGIENETIVTVSSDTTVTLALIKEVKPPNKNEEKNTSTIENKTPISPAPVQAPVPAPPVQNPKEDTSLKWFLYVINKTDELIGKTKQKEIKLKLVFVPIGYNESEYEEFKLIAQATVNRFALVSPLKECKNPQEMIETTFIFPSSCNITGCSDICGVSDKRSNNCQLLVESCIQKTTRIVEYGAAVGLCKGRACSDQAAGCANGIPGTTIVLNTDDDKEIAKKRATHELGHIFGLYHVKSENSTNGCWDDEKGACKGENAADCSVSAEVRSKNIMAYCPFRENYGFAGTAYLKKFALKDYLGACLHE
jgi:hypothetical protein